MSFIAPFSIFFEALIRSKSGNTRRKISLLRNVGDRDKSAHRHGSRPDRKSSVESSCGRSTSRTGSSCGRSTSRTGSLCGRSTSRSRSVESSSARSRIGPSSVQALLNRTDYLTLEAENATDARGADAILNQIYNLLEELDGQSSVVHRRENLAKVKNLAIGGDHRQETSGGHSSHYLHTSESGTISTSERDRRLSSSANLSCSTRRPSNGSYHDESEKSYKSESGKSVGHPCSSLEEDIASVCSSRHRSRTRGGREANANAVAKQHLPKSILRNRTVKKLDKSHSSNTATFEGSTSSSSEDPTARGRRASPKVDAINLSLHSSSINNSESVQSLFCSSTRMDDHSHHSQSRKSSSNASIRTHMSRDNNCDNTGITSNKKEITSLYPNQQHSHRCQSPDRSTTRRGRNSRKSSSSPQDEGSKASYSPTGESASRLSIRNILLGKPDHNTTANNDKGGFNEKKATPHGNSLASPNREQHRSRSRGRSSTRLGGKSTKPSSVNKNELERSDSRSSRSLARKSHLNSSAQSHMSRGTGSDAGTDDTRGNQNNEEVPSKVLAYPILDQPYSAKTTKVNGGRSSLPGKPDNKTAANNDKRNFNEKRVTPHGNSLASPNRERHRSRSRGRSSTRLDRKSTKPSSVNKNEWERPDSRSSHSWAKNSHLNSSASSHLSRGTGSDAGADSTIVRAVKTARESHPKYWHIQCETNLVLQQQQKSTAANPHTESLCVVASKRPLLFKTG